jgi:uncharacterized membrane protein YebE (DUF533 family)
MAEMKSHLKLALASIRCFTDDGTLDLAELNYLLGIATADGVVDEEERRVPHSILDKMKEKDVNPRAWDRIQEIRSKYPL